MHIDEKLGDCNPQLYTKNDCFSDVLTYVNCIRRYQRKSIHNGVSQDYLVLGVNEESAKTAEIARQGETEESNTDSIVKTVSPQAPADSTPSTAEKPITETPLTKDIEPTQAQPEVLAKPAETTDVQVSPNSFGHYPQIPKEMGVPKDKVKIFWENVSVNPRHELLFRVRN